MTATPGHRERAARLAAMGPGGIRTACGITLAAMAEGLRVPKSTLWKWENGHRGPTGPAGAAYARVIAGLARHLEIPEEP